MFTVVTAIDPQQEVETMRMYLRLCRLKGDYDGARRWATTIADYIARHLPTIENTEASVEGGAIMP